MPPLTRLVRLFQNRQQRNPPQSAALRIELLEARDVPATISLSASADAFVRASTYASTNYGSTAQLVVDNHTNVANDREAYLAFDLGGVSGQVTGATLRLVPKTLGASSGSNTYRVTLVPDGGDGWIEGNGRADNTPTGEITWNNRPSATGPSITFSGSQLRRNQAFALDVTALVTDAANANGRASFRIDEITPTGTKGDVTFYSRQGSAAYRPVLELQVAATNRPPTATADALTTQSGVAASLNVLANDSDPDGNTLTLLNVGNASHGTISWSTNGMVTYTPAAGFSGSDSFTYTISDGHAQASGVVNVMVQSPAQASVWPERIFAPFVDATGWPLFDLVQASRDSGVQYFNLGFIVADTSNQPSWGGYYSVASGFRQTEIEQLRQLGGDVIMSFGGAAGTELAVAITDVNALTAAYQFVIDTYGLTRIDFDIEGAWVAQTSSVDRRSQAIRNLQDNAAAAGRTLEVWYTLPVLPSGLTHDGVRLLDSALRYGVDIAGVNVMAMDYGDSAAPNPEGQMGLYAIQSATSLFGQLKKLYSSYGPKSDAELWRMVGVTPMIGQNDVPTERFYLEDARELYDFALEKEIGMLAMWSINRDRTGPSRQLSSDHSGVSQAPFEFSSIFKPFTGDSMPGLALSNASVVEGDAGSKTLIFNVTLSAALTTPVTVQYATANGTATAGSDFQTATGTLTFAPGETQKSILVTVHGDLAAESDETFAVVLTNAVGAVIRTAQATGTIRDDDQPPTATIGDVAVVEGNSGSKLAVFTVTLSRTPKAGEIVSVQYSTANGSATSGSDYQATSGTLTFAAGETAKFISIVILGDTTPEAHEMFRLNLTATGATLQRTQATGTISDDDTPADQVRMVVSSQWGTGFIGQVTITNTTSQTWTNWTLEFDSPFELVSIWSAEIVSRVGNHYVIRPADWTRQISPGASITFGFEAFGNPNDVLSNVQFLPV